MLVLGFGGFFVDFVLSTISNKTVSRQPILLADQSTKNSYSRGFLFSPLASFIALNPFISGLKINFNNFQIDLRIQSNIRHNGLTKINSKITNIMMPICHQCWNKNEPRLNCNNWLTMCYPSNLFFLLIFPLLALFSFVIYS